MQEQGQVQMRKKRKVIYLEIMKVIMLHLFLIELWYTRIIIIMKNNHILGINSDYILTIK